MSLVILTSNNYDGEIVFTDVTNAYFFVITPKPFEAKWVAFKAACREHFVTYHIVFLTPLVENPDNVKAFLFNYGKMLRHVDEDMRIYD
jgi:hypothetical protein